MTRGKWTAIAVVTLALAGCSEPVVDVEVKPVVPVIPVASITIDALPASLLPGVSAQLTARALGSDGQTLTGRTITFSGFNNSVARVSNSGMVTTVAPGTMTVTASAEGQFATRDLTINYPLPTLSAVEPGALPTGIASTIIVRGSGFYPGTVVRLNGVARPSTPLSFGAAYVNLSAADVAAVGAAAISVFNPTPGGGTSGSLSLSVQPANLCDVSAPFTLGTTVAGALDPTDCNSGPTGTPFYQDVYKFTTTALTTAVTFTMTSPFFNSFLFVSDATNSTALHASSSGTPPNPAIMRLLLPAGTFAAIPGAVNSGAVGAYFFASTALIPPVITNCENWYVVPGLTLAESVTRGDCDDHGWYWDTYSIVLRAGQTVTITLESTAFDAALWLYDSNGSVHDDNSAGGTNAKIVFTPTAGGVFVFDVGPSAPYSGVTGAYMLRIN